MNKLLTALFALTVASVTSVGHAQTPPPAAAQAPAAANSIESKVAMCIGCHGIPGYQASFPEVHKVPMISGQGAKYIIAALNAYKTGDRKHPTMRGIAATMTEQDMADVAAYYEAHGKQQAPADKPARQANPKVAALLQKGACVSCHGANFDKPIDPSYPKVAGQHADYLFVALKAYKAENSPVLGRANGVMGGVVKQFSNAELKAMSNYIGSLDGGLKTVPDNRFR